MKNNEGTTDRIVRVCAGLLLIGLAATQVLGPWAYVGIVPLVTGAMGFCPVYKLLGMSTCPLNRR